MNHLLTTAQAAERLGVGVHTVRRLVASGELAHADLSAVGSKRECIRIRTADLDALVEARTRRAPTTGATDA